MDNKRTKYVYYVPCVTGSNRPDTIPKGAQQRRKAVQGEHPWKPCTLQPHEWYAVSYNTEFRWPERN